MLSTIDGAATEKISKITEELNTNQQDQILAHKWKRTEIMPSVLSNPNGTTLEILNRQITEKSPTLNKLNN